jgi:pimeloyl-ACP methyl ester carboxylesterase
MPTREDIVDIDVGEGHIAGTLIAPGTRLPGVLFVHGWGGSQEQYVARAREVAALGSICLTFDLRGHGGTKPQYETVSREKNLADVLAAYEVLAAHRAVDPSSIALVGSSYGGYLGALLASMRPVRWLALRVPALYMDLGWDIPKRQLHRGDALIKYRSHLVPVAENRALRACALFKGDVLVVESERDSIIPHAVIASYLDAFAGAHSLTYRTMKDADHGLTEERWQRAYTGLLVNWLGEMITGAREGDLRHEQVATPPSKHAPERPPAAA